MYSFTRVDRRPGIVTISDIVSLVRRLTASREEGGPLFMYMPDCKHRWMKSAAIKGRFDVDGYAATWLGRRGVVLALPFRGSM